VLERVGGGGGEVGKERCSSPKKRKAFEKRRDWPRPVDVSKGGRDSHILNSPGMVTFEVLQTPRTSERGEQRE